MQRSRVTCLILLFATVFASACGSQISGRFEDADHNYVDFRPFGKAFTNVGAGGAETQITYSRDGERVTLHQLDGNPTLHMEKDGSLCCGPSGPLKRIN